MEPQYQPRKYFCVAPVADSCRKGFRTLDNWTHHKNTVHYSSSMAPTKRPPQYPYQHRTSGDSDRDEEDLPEGPFFVQHPILDGKLLTFI